VFDEAARGDVTMARKRLEMLAEIPLLVITDGVVRIAQELQGRCDAGALAMVPFTSPVPS
jgi:hypothetical protein